MRLGDYPVGTEVVMHGVVVWAHGGQVGLKFAKGDKDIVEWSVVNSVEVAPTNVTELTTRVLRAAIQEALK